MRPFVYESPSSAQEAASHSAPDSLFIAGGTTVLDLMKLEVMKPARLVDVNALPMRGVEMREDGLRIGALEKMSGVALHPEIVANYPVISQALLQSASPQIRNMASMGGNLLQRTRCGYFRDVTTPCHKREPGSGCSAINGENRMHAILGTSSSCVATNASDLAVALVALDASLQLQKGGETRLIKLDDFYLVPGDTPERENLLQPGELITQILVPRFHPPHKTSVPEPGPSWRLLALIALKSRLREFALNLGIQRCRLHPPPEARLQCPASLPPSRKLLSPPRKNLSRSPFATKNRPSSA